MGGKRGERASSPSATRPMSRQRRVCATVCSADPQQLQLAPAPKQTKPSAHECVQVYQALAQLFPEKAATPKPNHGPRRSVLDSLVGTMLSQNTTDTTSARAFAQLKAAFPEWEQVRTAEPADVEKQIKVCGLAATRAERIQAILQTLHAEQGVCSLEHLCAANCSGPCNRMQPCVIHTGLSVRVPWLDRDLRPHLPRLLTGEICLMRRSRGSCLVSKA